MDIQTCVFRPLTQRTVGFFATETSHKPVYFPHWRRELLGSLLQWSVVPFQCLTVIKEKNAMHNEIPQFWSLFLLLLFASHWGCMSGVGWGWGGLVKDAKKHLFYSYSLQLSWQPVILISYKCICQRCKKKWSPNPMLTALDWVDNQFYLLT